MHVFEQCRLDAERLVHPDDRDAVIRALDRKNLVAALDRNRTFVITCRVVPEKEPTYVSMRVCRLEDDDRTLILGIADIDREMKQRRAAERLMEEHIAYARLNALTGDFLCVYVVVPETGRYREFSATAGYEAFAQAKEGMDFYTATREACKIICEIFKHSPVFRVGGDEFAVICQGSDYAAIDELVGRVNAHNAQARPAGGVVIACGMARHAGEDSVAPVFERADQNMYQNKSDLKS